MKTNNELVLSQLDPVAFPFLQMVHFGLIPMPSVSIIQCVSELTRFFNGQTSLVQFPATWFRSFQKLMDQLPSQLWGHYCGSPADDGRVIAFAEVWSQLEFQNLPGSFRAFEATPAVANFLQSEEEGIARASRAKVAAVSDALWLIPFLGKTDRFLVERFRTNGKLRVLQYSANGNFELIPDWQIDEKSVQLIPHSNWSSEDFAKFAQNAKSKPLNFPSVEFFRNLADEIGCSVEIVGKIWFGLAAYFIPADHFLHGQFQKTLGLNKRECLRSGIDHCAFPLTTVRVLTNAIVEGGPDELWETLPVKAANRLKEAWCRVSAARIPLTKTWVDELIQATMVGNRTPRFLEALNSPQSHPMFSKQGKWAFDMPGSIVNLKCDDPSVELQGDLLKAAIISMALLAYGLPVGDPARNQMCQVYDSVTQALQNPDLLLLDLIRREDTNGSAAALLNLAQSTVGKLKSCGTLQIADDGVAVVAVHYPELRFAFRPAALTTNRRIERFLHQFELLTNQEHQSFYFDDTGLFNIVREFRWKGFADLIRRIEDTPLPPGSYECNPQLSAPEIVKKVVRRYEVSSEAAAYFLQLLALPDPTDANVSLWNGWNKATIKKLGGELVSKQYIVEDKRSRAGRKYFLSGDWQEASAPLLPLESWKLPFYGIEPDHSGRLNPPFGRILPLTPVHTLFADAWYARIDDEMAE